MQSSQDLAGLNEEVLQVRIAFVADPDSPGGWYRGIGPMGVLLQLGHDVRQIHRLDGTFREDLIRGCDVLHVYRWHDDQAVAAIKAAKQLGIAVVWDNDDDIGAIPRQSAAYRANGGFKRVRSTTNIRRIVQLADLVTTPSARLAELYADLGASRAEAIENYVPDTAWSVRRQRHREVVFCWTAGLEHRPDMHAVPIAPALERLLATRDDVRVVTLGVNLGFKHERYEHVPKVPFSDLPRVLAGVDVGLAPLAANSFNQSRSNVKVKEYAAAGACWLASPVGPYAEMDEAQGGRLVADDDWHEQLERLVRRRRELRRLAKTATRWGRAQSLSANIAAWESRLLELCDRPVTVAV